MKRKFLSVVMCLMFSLASMFMLSACVGKEPVVVAQNEAETAFNTAMETLAQTNSIKMTMAMPENAGNMVVIVTEDKSYVEMTMAYADADYGYEMAVTAWTEVNDDSCVTHTNMRVTEDGETGELSTKTISLLDDDVFENEYTEEFFDGLDFEDFVKATELDGEISIVFKDDKGTKFTAKIVDEKLVSIKITKGKYSSTMYLHYGDFVNEIPALPEKDWTLTSTFEIKGLKTTYVQGEEEPSLLGMELKFYEEADDSETLTITSEMLSKITVTGFDSSELTNGTPKEMTITYLGITVTVEYEVVAAQ